MAGASEWYGLAFFDFGEDLGSDVSVQKEVDRFIVIDKQLYGMYQIFGDGIIAGWEVEDGEGLSVRILPGTGILASLALESTFSETIDSLGANQVYNIYATLDGNTITNRDVSFLSSFGTLPDALLLATVTTGGTGVETIDNTVRTPVGFKAIIQEEIAKHRHDGVSAPKIDLNSETQGLLPNDRMADLDASKFVTGRLPNKVMPTIDHENLSDIGRFTHAGLDAIAQILQTTNLNFFGEIVTANLLKDILIQKYDNTTVDKRFINELAIIPGISPDSVVDWENTTAAVDKTNHCISGIPAFSDELSGHLLNFSDLQIVTVSWVHDADFEQANIITNLTIDSGVSISNDSIFDRTIDSFEGTGVANPIPGGVDPDYVSSLVETNTTNVLFNSSVTQGQLAGFFESNSTRHAVFKRTFTRTQDWTLFSHLIVNIKNYSATHAAVRLSVKDKNGVDLATFQLLAEDEVTVTSNVENNGYATKSFSLSGISRAEVGGYVAYTGNILSETEGFYMDNIILRNENILLPQGNLRFRYNTTSAVVFNSVEFTSSIPDGTDLRVRVRVASSLEALATAPFGPLLNSGEVIGLNGSYIEIDITFLSDSNRVETPTLTALFLTLLVPSSESGLIIDDEDGWNRGVSLENITVTDSGIVELTNTNVNDIYFVTENIVNELNPDLNPVVGVNGGSIPITPSQGYATIHDQNAVRGFDNPKSALRLLTGNYLVCDTGNDRIVEVAEDGTFVRGFASHNADYSTVTFALCANYNPRLGMLFIAYSKAVDLTNFDLTTVTLSYNAFSNTLVLNNTTDQVRTLTGTLVERHVVTGQTGATTGVTERVLSVILDSSQISELANVTSPIFVTILNDLNIQPIEVFVGDYMYFGNFGLYRPIHAFQSDESEWTVLNSRISSSADAAKTTVVSLLQFSLSIGEFPVGQTTGLPIGLTYAFNGIDFSDIMLGSAFDLGNNKLLIAGLQALPSSTTTTTTTTTTTPLTDTQKLSKYVGTVIVLDTRSSIIAFRYQSPDGLYPSDCTVDENGYYAVAESSLLPQAGRIIKLDQYGNIVFLTEGGMFTKVNDIRLITDNNLFVST